MGITCCYIKEQFFIDHPCFTKMLDSGNTAKQARRTHLCLKIMSNGNAFYIPLRSHLGDEVRKYGRIGHKLPTASRPDAGLDYRYSLVINNPVYIDIATKQRLPNSQYKKLQNEITDIELEFEQYLSGFMRVARKNRVAKDALYRESSLINFLNELGIATKEPVLT